MMSRGILAVALIALSAPAAAAMEGELADPYGAALIMKGRYTTVEPRLQAAYSRGDRRPEVLLNLAAVRLNGRDSLVARRLYRMVLDQPNFDMATPRGSAWSHDIARRGIARTGSELAGLGN